MQPETAYHFAGYLNNEVTNDGHFNTRAEGGVLAQQTVYDHYTEGGIQKGLEALEEGFKLNGKNITLQSGAIHYFRVHPAYWRDRLRKLRATGLIAVETYVPWNLHEPQKDVFDFGDGGNDMSEFLDVVKFVEMAQEEDLLVLFRPGPYICAEWEMGGLPSWLHRIKGIRMRTSEPQYQERADKFLSRVLSAVKHLQFTQGGPIIAFQLENEYSTSEIPGGIDQQHLTNLKATMDRNGIVELLFTSDNTPRAEGSIPEALRTINFQEMPQVMLSALKLIQPDKPAMVMEYWTGWFDHWMSPAAHNRFSPQEFQKNLETIINFPASFNLYMFHGGTSFGFLNGANFIVTKDFDVTSYDYDSPLSEAGDYTVKYNITKDTVAKYAGVGFLTPAMPAETTKVSYTSTPITHMLTLGALYDAAGSRVKDSALLAMEDLPINNDNGQSYGFAWYRATGRSITSGSILKITGQVHDFAQVFVDGQLQTKIPETMDDTKEFGYWKIVDGELTLTTEGTTLDILVENLGRVNYGKHIYIDKKGLFDGPVLLDGQEVSTWDITPLEFQKSFLQRLENATWDQYESGSSIVAPGLYRAVLTIEGTPNDTFLDMSQWVKGVVFVNGFNLGRYNRVGPPRTLFLPAPLLKSGENQIVVFEQFIPSDSLTFSETPKYA